MTSVTDAPGNPLPFGRSRSDRTIVGRAIGWLRANLFASISSSIVTLLLFFVLAKAFVGLAQWGFLNAVWSVPGSDTSACRAIRGLGACWAVIPEKLRFILFGTYPFDQQWRPALAMLVFLALFYASSRRQWWRKELVLVWAAALTLIGILMWGGIPGMPFVSQDRWGGLPVTLILATFGLAFGFPLGIVVALGRRSKLPAIRSLSVLYVELIRGVPLISLLFMASVMFPRQRRQISPGAGRVRVVRRRLSCRGHSRRLAGRSPGAA
jgi:general L-amino acid transport system permease protein